MRSTERLERSVDGPKSDHPIFRIFLLKISPVLSALPSTKEQRLVTHQIRYRGVEARAVRFYLYEVHH
jgi:hypothetical protein